MKLNYTQEGQEIKEVIAVALYSNGLFTKSQSAELVDLTMREFHALLSKHGVSISGISTDEVLSMYSQSLDR